MNSVAQWWHALQARERVLLGVGAVSLCATIYWLAVVEPLAARETRLVKAVTAERETQAWLAEQRGRIAPGGATSPHARLPDDASLLAAINDSAAASGVGAHLTRVTPAGSRSATLGFSEVPYASFMRWLVDVDARYGATVDRIRLERAEAPGIVNVELSLSF